MRRGYNDVDVFMLLLRNSQLIPVCTANNITHSTFNIFVYSNNLSVYPRKWAGTHCTGSWVGSMAGLDVCGKSRPPPGHNHRTIQPIVSGYTDWAIVTNIQKQALRFGICLLPSSSGVEYWCLWQKSLWMLVILLMQNHCPHFML